MLIDADNAQASVIEGLLAEIAPHNTMQAAPTAEIAGESVTRLRQCLSVA
jgi:hypothetical protein